MVRRHFKNWASIIADYSLGRSPEKFVLADGRVLDFTNFERRFEFATLARVLDAGWIVQGFDDEFMTLRGALTMKIRYREPQEVFAMGEVFVDQVYACDCAGKTVLDVGMSNGNSSMYFAWLGAKKVIGLEPSPESYGLAKENIFLNHMEDKIEPLNAALGVTTGRGRLSTLTSRVDTSGESEERDSRIDVATVSFEELKKDHEIDIVKMDCEGCEYPIIENLGKESLEGISEFVLEFHAKGPIPIADRLRAEGFDVTYTGKQTGILRARRKE